VPGIGVKNAWRIKEARKHATVTLDSLKKMRVAMTRARHFITANGKFAGIDANPDYIRAVLADNAAALPENSLKYLKGEQLSFL
jgi:predicted DNA-binding helix-hairpin-helix protein